MLYVSAQRQIGKAFKMVGLTPETKNIVLVLFTGSKKEVEAILNYVQSMVGGNLNNQVMEKFSEEKIENLKKIFEISNLEIETQKTGKTNLKEVIEKLVIERVALLATQS